MTGAVIFCGQNKTLKRRSINFETLFFLFFIILYPIIPSYTSIFGIRINSLMAFFAFVVMIFSKSFWRCKNRTHILLISLIPIIVLGFVSLINKDLFSLSYFSQIVQFFFVPLYIFSFLSQTKERKKYLKIVLAVGVIVCILSITELFGFNFFSLISNTNSANLDAGTSKRFGIYRLESSFGQAIAFAIFLSYMLVLSYFFTAYYKPDTTKQVFNCVFLILFFNVFILLTLSRFPILVGLIINFLGLLIINKRTRITLLILLFAIAVVAFPISSVLNITLISDIIDNIISIFNGSLSSSENPVTYRSELYYYGYKVVVEKGNLFTGIGIMGDYSFEASTPFGGFVVLDSFDNAYVYLFVIQGVIGILVWIFYYLFLLCAFEKIFKDKHIYNAKVIGFCGILVLLATLLNMFSVSRLDESRSFCVVFPMLFSYAFFNDHGEQRVFL